MIAAGRSLALARGRASSASQVMLALGVALSLAVPARAGLRPKVRFIENPSPPYKLNLAASQADVEVFLDSLILPGGPGSWVRDALWDEYVLTVVNRGGSPITIDRIRIIDPRGIYIDPGNAVIQVEEMSRSLMDEYAAAGVAYVLASSATYAAWGLGVGGVVGGVALAPAAVVAAPAYILWKRSKQRKDRAKVDAEFGRRLMGSRNPYGLGGVRPYTPVAGLSAIVKIGPGGSISGSNFFPIVPNPEALVVEFRRGDVGHTLRLPIRESIEGIHVPVSEVDPHRNLATGSLGDVEDAPGELVETPAPGGMVTPVESAKPGVGMPREELECSVDQRAEMAGMGLSEAQIAAACGGNGS